MERPKEGCSDEDYRKWYWSDFADQCKKCKNNCKQSHVVIQVICNKFNKIEV